MHDRVGIELDKVEVRFEDLRVTAFAENAGRTLPSIWNSYRNAAEVSPFPADVCTRTLASTVPKPRGMPPQSSISLTADPHVNCFLRLASRTLLLPQLRCCEGRSMHMRAVTSSAYPFKMLLAALAYSGLPAHTWSP